MAIPKQIFFYWGGLSLSYSRYMTLFSFRKFHPDWRMILFLDENPKQKTWISEEKLDEFSGINYLDNLSDLNIEQININSIELPFSHNDKSYVHTKDTLNWFLLYQNGGVVCDMDILFIKSMDYLVDKLNNKNIDIALVEFENNPKPGYIPVSFMISSPGQSFIKKCFDNAVNNYNPLQYESCGTPCFPTKTIKDAMDKFLESKFGKLKSECVFPTCIYEYNTGLHQLFVKDVYNFFKPETFAIHWYGGSPISNSWSKSVNEYNFSQHSNTMTTAILKIMEK